MTDEQHSVKAASTYVVLAKERPYGDDDDPDAVEMSAQLWVHVGEVEARGAEEAVRKHVERTSASAARVYVAVPARSFRPMRVTPKVETTFVIGDAS